MKRILFSIFLILLSCSYSFSIDKETARKVAQTVLNVRQAEKVTLVKNAFPETKAGAGDDFSPFYVFNSDRGFAIVSGYEAAHPVLAYSKSGSFDYSRIPPAMKDLLMMMSDVIVDAKKASLKPSLEIRAEWDQYLYGTKASEKQVLLETAHWGQGPPYNDLCPLDEGERSATGCTNTATAIIMRYHKWPEKGKGILPDYENYLGKTIVTYPGHALGHTYDWDNMPTTSLSFDNTLTEYQKQQVAQLMYDVGIMNQSEYSSQQTAAGLNEAGLVGYFNYDPGIQKMTRGDYNRDLEWEAIIKNEIDASRPIFYTLLPDNLTSHAVVIDGYSGPYFHINFGWNGNDDAFMLLTPIEGEGSFVTSKYRLMHAMIVGIQPNKSDNPAGVKSEFLFFGGAFDYEVGKEFPMRAWLSNYTFEEKNITVAVGLTDGSGNLEEIISPIQEVSVGSSFRAGWYSGMTLIETQCIINSSLRPDQKIQLFQKENGQWQKIISNDNGIFRMGCGGQLRQKSELEFIKTVPEDVEWEQVCFRLPPDAMLKIEEKGTLLWKRFARTQIVYTSFDDIMVYNSSKNLRVYKTGDIVGGRIGYVVVEKKKSTPSCNIQVTIYDLEETATFSLTL